MWPVLEFNFGRHIIKVTLNALRKCKGGLPNGCHVLEILLMVSAYNVSVDLPGAEEVAWFLA